MSLNGHLSSLCRRRQNQGPTRRQTGRLMPPVRSCFWMGFTCALSVTSQAVVSYTALPPYRQAQSARPAVYFCCTVLGVASTRRYLASCPVKPGLSSPATFRSRVPRPFVLLKTLQVYHIFLYLSSYSQTASARLYLQIIFLRTAVSG